MGVNGSGLNDCPLNVATLSILYNPCLEASRAKQRAGASMSLYALGGLSGLCL